METSLHISFLMAKEALKHMLIPQKQSTSWMIWKNLPFTLSKLQPKHLSEEILLVFKKQEQWKMVRYQFINSEQHLNDFVIVILLIFFSLGVSWVV